MTPYVKKGNVSSKETVNVKNRVTQDFWSRLTEWVSEAFTTQCIFNDPYFIVTNMHNVQIMETVMINAKQYIHRCFINKESVKIEKFKYCIYMLEETERYIATQKNVLHVHERKWLNFMK